MGQLYVDAAIDVVEGLLDLDGHRDASLDFHE